MRIAQIVSTYPPYRGGMGNVAAAMSAKLAEKGHDVLVLTPDYAKKPVQTNGGVKRIAPLFSYGNSAFVPKLYSYLKTADVLHLHYPFFGGAETVAWFKKRHPETPLVITYHMDVEGGGLLKLFFQVYGRTLCPWILKSADAVLVSSLDYAQHSVFLPTDKLKNLVEMPFGIDEVFQPPETLDTDNELWLLFVGGLDKAHYFKGLDRLLNACAKLKQNGQVFRLGIVGDGELKAQYQKLAQKLGLGSEVVFRGKLSEVELILAYQHADLTILPSIDRSEAFGLVLLESMACGTPVIASDLPGVRTVVKNNITGLLVKPGDSDSLHDAIQSLAENPEKLLAMAQASVRRVNDHYRWPQMIDKLELLYKELLRKA